MFYFLSTNGFIEQRIHKGFLPRISGNCEHTTHLAYLIRQAKRRQKSLVGTLLDLRNAFGEVHHHLIPVVLKYHHMPESVIKLINSLYRNFPPQLSQIHILPSLCMSRTASNKVIAKVYCYLICWSTPLFNL